jgi:hypothetical protein
MTATLRGNVDKNCRISATQKVIWPQCGVTSAAKAYPRPCDLKLRLSALNHVAAERRLTVRVAAPPTLRSMEWRAVALFFKTADVGVGSN